MVWINTNIFNNSEIRHSCPWTRVKTFIYFIYLLLRMILAMSLFWMTITTLRIISAIPNFVEGFCLGISVDTFQKLSLHHMNMIFIFLLLGFITLIDFCYWFIPCVPAMNSNKIFILKLLNSFLHSEKVENAVLILVLISLKV